MKHVVIFHGGPGVDSSYLRPHLDGLADHGLGVAYVDQLGCWPGYEAPTSVTLEKTMVHFRERLSGLELGEDFAFLGHSWGTHLILAMLARFPELKPREVVLSNSFPTTREGLQRVRDQAAAVLARRLTPEQEAERQRLAALGTPKAGHELLKIIAPLYVEDPKFVPELHYGYYDPRVAAAMELSIRRLDARPLVRHLPARTLVLTGEHDYIRPADQEGLVRPEFSTHVFAGVGHSPFVEAREEFLGVVGGFLSGPR